MLKVRLTLTVLTLASFLLICAAGAHAALVKTDLLGGFGEFEFSADTTWQMATDKGWPYGVKQATPDDSVAAGWARLTDYGVVPEQDTIYKIVPGDGINGSNHQYFAIKNARASQKRAFLRMWLPVKDDMPSNIHHGDQLTFRLDRLFMSDYSLPIGAWVRYRVFMSISAPGKPDSTVSIDLKPSATPFSTEVTGLVVPNASGVQLMVEIAAGGNIGAATPGIHIDGARLYRKSSGKSSYDMEEVPAPRKRAINTQMIFFKGLADDTYAVARDFDSVMLQYESEYQSALRLKYYNPSIKVLLYETGGVINDWRDQNRVDPPYSNCPLGFNNVLANHIDWLYAWPGGRRTTADNRPAWLRDANCITVPDSPISYIARVSDSDYQQHWAEAAADKVKRYRLDGVFLDGMEAIQSTANAPVNRTDADVQSFQHGVLPSLHQAGVKSMMNYCVAILGQSPANSFFDPNWKTNKTYSLSQGYEDNSPENTPDALFQEWAFFRHWPTNGVDINRYDVVYWDGTLANLEAVAIWNTTLPADSKKSVSVLTHGVDRSGDPALGLDGWANFGLCSFMLAQNQNTWFGASMVNGTMPVKMDMSGTVRLGAAMGNRTMLGTDKSLQMRLYKNGLVIVNGHPTASKGYKLNTKAIGQNGVAVAAGQTITLRPHTGRMYFYK